LQLLECPWKELLEGPWKVWITVRNHRLYLKNIFKPPTSNCVLGQCHLQIPSIKLPIITALDRTPTWTQSQSVMICKWSCPMAGFTASQYSKAQCGLETVELSMSKESFLGGVNWVHVIISRRSWPTNPWNNLELITSS
jgi:hypothetical protein